MVIVVSCFCVGSSFVYPAIGGSDLVGGNAYAGRAMS